MTRTSSIGRGKIKWEVGKKLNEAVYIERKYKIVDEN
jgi:hypothetical protein